LLVNIKFICTSFRNRQNSEPSANFSRLFRGQKSRKTCQISFIHSLVPVSYLSASYRVPGKFIRIVRTVYQSSTNKAKMYSYSIFVQQMYWLQDKQIYCVGVNNTLDLLFRQNVLVLGSWCLTPSSYNIYICKVTLLWLRGRKLNDNVFLI
jgi:hypothetical protein